jgi:hypothetical protein
VSSARKRTYTCDSHALSHFYVNGTVPLSLFAVQESDTRALIVGLTCWTVQVAMEDMDTDDSIEAIEMAGQWRPRPPSCTLGRRD